MPDEIDVTNAGEALALITAAFAPGATVVVADLTATRFCDSSGLRHLALACSQAAEAGTDLRLVVPTAGSVRRVLELTGIGRYMSVYSTLALAIADIPSALSETRPDRRPNGVI